MKTLELWTDGSCKKNGQKGAYGGWGAVIIDKGDCEYRAYGKEEATTNNAMEMKAIIKGLNFIKEKYENSVKVIVYSDSAYILNCRTQRWYDSWIKNGWKNSKKEKVKNRELWEELIPYFEDELIDFQKVAGHVGIEYNEMVDNLAQSAAEGVELYGISISENDKDLWKIFKEI